VLRNDGTVFGMGDNSLGRIGIGTTGGNVTTLSQIGLIGGAVSSIGGGEFHALGRPRRRPRVRLGRQRPAAAQRRGRRRRQRTAGHGLQSLRRQCCRTAAGLLASRLRGGAR
jgi:hypothetical protein